MVKNAVVGFAALLLPFAVQAQSMEEGRELYQGRCLSCHGDSGTAENWVRTSSAS